MTRCKVCTSEKHGRAVDTKIKAGESFASIAAWLSAQGENVSAMAISRHAAAHLALAPRPSGPAPMSGSFLEKTVGLVEQRMDAGDLQPTMRDGLTAQKLLDDRGSKQVDHEIALRFAQILGGATPAGYFDKPTVVIEGKALGKWEVDTYGPEKAAEFAAIDDEIAALTEGT